MGPIRKHKFPFHEIERSGLQRPVVDLHAPDPPEIRSHVFLKRNEKALVCPVEMLQMHGPERDPLVPEQRFRNVHLFFFHLLYAFRSHVELYVEFFWVIENRRWDLIDTDTIGLVQGIIA